jgi:hypothetical protein
MRAYTTSYFADVYGHSTYGSCDYNQTNCSTAAGGSTGSGSGSGGLVDTGMAIAVIVTAACLIIFVSLLVRFWRRPARKPKHNLGETSDNVSQKH